MFASTDCQVHSGYCAGAKFDVNCHRLAIEVKAACAAQVSKYRAKYCLDGPAEILQAAAWVKAFDLEFPHECSMRKSALRWLTNVLGGASQRNYVVAMAAKLRASGVTA